MSAADSILQLISSKGPVLPVQAAKHIGSNILMASAHLSELISRKKLKVSRIKVGGSPLYYAPGQEIMLENFVDNLNEKQKEAFSLLKEKKVVKDADIQPAHRVALRELKDFAFPLEVKYNNTQEIFWKWHSITNEEVNNLIREILSPQPKPEPKQEVKPEPQSIEPAQEIKAEEPKATKPQEKKPEPKKEIQKKIQVEKKAEKEKNKEPEKKQIKLETAGEETKEPEEDITSPFINELAAYFSKNSVSIIEKAVLRKDSEVDFVIEVPSNVGNLIYFCKAKSKKRINDGDLSSAFIQGQTKKLPVLFLTKGDLTKRAQEMLKNEFKGMTLAKL
ncbi:hypothetical protein JW707_04470 [Candidatus Woesearchaeota archaeon]|nr:hypothetical protein [Candidatus Woesearchaeota archaeon]